MDGQVHFSLGLYWPLGAPVEVELLHGLTRVKVFILLPGAKTEMKTDRKRPSWEETQSEDYLVFLFSIKLKSRESLGCKSRVCEFY